MPDCLARALPGRARGPGLAVSVTGNPFSWTQQAVIFNEPGRWMVWRVWREAAGTQHRGSCEAGAGVGAALNITALVSEKWSKANTQTPLDRSVCRSLMPSEAPELFRSGGRGLFPFPILFIPFIPHFRIFPFIR